MKTCPQCGTWTFDDAQGCYACNHLFESPKPTPPTHVFDEPKNGSVNLVLGSTPRTVTFGSSILEEMLDRLIESQMLGTTFEMYMEKPDTTLVHIISSDDTYILDENGATVLAERIPEISSTDLAKMFLEDVRENHNAWLDAEGLIVNTETMNDDEREATERACVAAKGRIAKLAMLIDLPDNDKENKPLFVERINQALIECHPRRYGYLRDTPLTYFVDEAKREMLRCGNSIVSVNLDSLPTMMSDIARLF